MWYAVIAALVVIIGAVASGCASIPAAAPLRIHLPESPSFRDSLIRTEISLSDEYPTMIQIWAETARMQAYLNSGIMAVAEWLPVKGNIT